MMFTLYGAAVIVGNKNGVASVWRLELKQLSGQLFVAHKEDIGRRDSLKHVMVRKDIATLLGTIHKIFSNSFAKRKFRRICQFTMSNVLTFRYPNEVRLFLSYFEVH
jgi:hypothetical protein